MRIPAIAVGLGLVLAGALPAAAQTNVLVLMADDMGVDRLAAYGEHPDPGNTPVLDQLAADGMLFRNAWANPVCSTTRATILTGQHSYRTGVGRGIGFFLETWELDPSTPSLPDALPAAYTSHALGKWHLSTEAGTGLLHPLLMGFDSHKGAPAVIPPSQTYSNFQKSVDGVYETVTEYATTDTVDDAIAAVNTLPEPWFVMTSFHAPHAPFHAPPAGLHSYTLGGDPDDTPVDHVKASIEAMDTEIGRLLAAMDPAVRANTVIVFLGDNGTDALATSLPFQWQEAKKTVYEGGLNVPLIVEGPGVQAGAECAGLVHTVDLFRTITDLTGGDGSTGVDSVSMVPYFSDPGQASLRDWLYAEMFEPNGLGPKDSWDRAGRDERYKLIFRVDDMGSIDEEFYDLDVDPFEDVNLLDQGPLSGPEFSAYEQLAFNVESLSNNWTDLGFGLAGLHGEPQLLGSGEMYGGDVIRVRMRNAAGNAPSFLFLGLAPLYHAPFYGGTLVPDLNTLPGTLTIVQTNPFGVMNLASLWPVGAPSGLEVYLQYWVTDAAAPFGFSATNGVVGVSP